MLVTEILRPVSLVGNLEQPDKDPCVQIAIEEYEQSKIRDPTRLVISQLPHNFCVAGRAGFKSPKHS
jgi:hypothetical protein